MPFKHAPAAVSLAFDNPSLVFAARLVPILRLPRQAGLDELARERLSAATDKGSNAGAKVMAPVARMLAGAGSIDDFNPLRHGGMGRLFDRAPAPSTLRSFLRGFRFGHVRQLDAVASRMLRSLTRQALLLMAREVERVMVNLDDTILDAIRDEATGRWISKADAARCRSPRSGPGRGARLAPARPPRLPSTRRDAAPRKRSATATGPRTTYAHTVGYVPALKTGATQHTIIEVNHLVMSVAMIFMIWVTVIDAVTWAQVTVFAIFALALLPVLLQQGEAAQRVSLAGHPILNAAMIWMLLAMPLLMAGMTMSDCGSSGSERCVVLRR